MILTDDPNGFKVVDLAPSGAAQLSGAVKPGDIILGVSDEAGGWVEAQTLPLDEMVGLIRGAQQSYVSLKVKSPNDPTPRTVTLGRSQLKTGHK
jgi:carboxyl-terminal processing protease